MNRSSAFSYRCECCGLCCRDKVITLAPYDIMRMADATGLSTGEVIARYTLRRGSLLRFGPQGACVALRDGLCGLHAGRPLPCRLYPLGLERTEDGERFVRLEAAAGSAGIYGNGGTVAGFLQDQEIEPYLTAVRNYSTLLLAMGKRVRQLADFEKVEPREFCRVAVREALAESNYDRNPLIEAIFDSDPWSGFSIDGKRSPTRHVEKLLQMLPDHPNAAQMAAAGVILTVSLGFMPAYFLDRITLDK